MVRPNACGGRQRIDIHWNCGPSGPGRAKRMPRNFEFMLFIFKILL